MTEPDDRLSIVVVGASGDLARRKIFPALFALYCQGLLPRQFRILGFARSEFTDEAFRAKITERLTCRYVPGESCGQRMDEFLSRCHYAQGRYDSADAMLDVFQHLQRLEEGRPAPRMFYLAIPPSVFCDVARAIGDSGMVSCDPHRPWSRVVIEKPFGRDRASSDQLTDALAQVFTEDQTFRIDHYLGKEVIQNLMVLRFANTVFEPLWNREFIRRVTISWREDLAIEGRGGYFDQYGIIRDVVQNHLLQILSLVAMEPPRTLQATHVRDEKVRALRCVPPVQVADLVLGQYTGAVHASQSVPGYREDETVTPDSRTPTFAAAALRVENDRWRGVPFLIEAGKGLDARCTEIRIAFRDVKHRIFAGMGDRPAANELVIRVQPDEAIYLAITSKVPGLGMALATRNLDLRYKAAFSQEIPDAYESLLLDVLRGEKGLFIRSDELAAAWDVFTPVLHEIEERRLTPEPYAFGSHGPAAAAALAERVGLAANKEDES